METKAGAEVRDAGLSVRQKLKHDRVERFKLSRHSRLKNNKPNRVGTG